MRPKKIVVGNKERNMSVGAFCAAVAVGYLIRKLEGSVKAFNDLFKPAVFGRYGIIIGKAYDLDQVEVHVLKGELLLSEFVGGIAVGSKFEGHAGEFFELGKGHTHCKDTRANITGAGYLISEY